MLSLAIRLGLFYQTSLDLPSAFLLNLSDLCLG